MSQKTRRKIMLMLAIAFLLVEGIAIWYWWNPISTKLKTNWWLLLAPYLSWRFLLVIVGRVALKGVMAIASGFIFDKMLKLIIGKDRLDRFKLWTDKWVKIILEEVKIRWTRYNLFEKGIIAMAAVQAAIIIVGAIFYIPPAKRKAIGMSQKKAGAGIIARIAALSIFRIPIAWFLALRVTKWAEKQPIVIRIRKNLSEL